MEKKMDMGGGGWLAADRDGPRVRLEAARPDDGKGLYKVWLRGSRGGELLLGTMIPQGGELRLSRTLSVDELERAGCWPDFRGESLLAFSFGREQGGGWYCEQRPARFFGDPLLKRQAAGPLLCRKGRGGVSVAVPFRPDRPLPLIGMICLARAERWPSGVHLVWLLDERGWPAGEKQEGKPGH